MSSDTKSKATKKVEYRIPEGSAWASAWKLPAMLSVIGAVISAVALSSDVARFGYAYLFAFMVVTTLVFGGLFLTIGLQLTAGIWGITSRRMSEVIAAGAVLVAVMFVPLAGGVASGAFTMYDEWRDTHHGHGSGEPPDDHEQREMGDAHGSLDLLGASRAQAQEIGDIGADQHGAQHTTEAEEHHPHTPQMEAQHHHLIEHKAPYLNQGGWLGRGVAYVLIWVLLGLFYYRTSRQQDERKDLKLTLKMKRFSPLAAILFGLSLTFASFDWLMSLEPAWYSTIFGVIIFGGSAVAIFSMLIILGVGLYQAGHTSDAINVEHFHDLGKFLFAFMCFWTYVSFSQWMLIWYAGIPEEATWYHKRWQDGWKGWALLLMLGHFVLPFYFLISRLVKRNLPMLRIGAVWLFAMHIADMYMMVLPQAGPFGRGFYFDVGALLLLGGIFMTYVLLMLKRVPLIPIGDPRLARSLHHHQTH